MSVWPEPCDESGCAEPAEYTVSAIGVPADLGGGGTAGHHTFHFCAAHTTVAVARYGVKEWGVGSLKPINHRMLLAICKPLPQDWESWGTVREEDVGHYVDCSCGCRWYAPLEGDLGGDWGVCTSSTSHRAGLLTFEHQAGHGCFEGGRYDDEDDEEVPG